MSGTRSREGAGTGEQPAGGGLDALGWGEHFARAFAAHGDDHALPGRVARVDRGGWVTAYTAEATVRARNHPRHRRIRDPLERPAVGDWAVLREDGGTPVLERILPRRTSLVRNLGGDDGRIQPQVVAANVDTVFILVALTAPANPRRIDRFLSIVRAGGAEPVLLHTKVDAVGHAGTAMAAVQRRARGVPVHAVSPKTGSGMSHLQPYLTAGRTVVLVGLSGVGKSTLVNRLRGEAVLETAAVRGDEKGRHTTSHRQLVLLPGGGLLIDTPGVRSIGLWEEEEESFDDVLAYAAQCHFTDCGHESEPGCAVRAALDRGDLSPARWASYEKLRAELEMLDQRRLAETRAAGRRRARPRRDTRSDPE